MTFLQALRKFFGPISAQELKALTDEGLRANGFEITP